VDWPVSQGADRYRRGLYVFRKRSMPDPALSSFDAPNSDAACARRVRSNIPLSALTGLNEPIFVEAAQALALRILREAGPSDRERARHAFRLCTGRDARLAEEEELLKLVNSMRGKLPPAIRKNFRRLRPTSHRKTPVSGRWSPAFCSISTTP
jgi:Protein of unknown function (DUF1553)